MNDKKSFLDHVNRKNKKDTVKESFSEEKFIKTKRSSFGPIVAISIMAIILIGFILMVNRKVEVIDLIDLTSEEAIEWGNQNNLILSSSLEYSKEDLNRVIAQSTNAGNKVKRGSIIKIVLSEGLDPYEKIELPNFDDSWSRSSIMVWLQEQGLNNYIFSSVVNDNVEEDFLINYRLIGTTEETFNRSSEIEFIVREVTDQSSIEVPSFIGSTLESVDIWAKNNGVSYSYSMVYDDIYNQDIIASQSILSGQNMNIVDVLLIEVSKGSENAPVEMVNLMNMTVVEAESWLKNNGVSYQLNYVYHNVLAENNVLDQSIYAGEFITDEVVTLRISLGESLQVMDFSVLTQNEAQEYALGHQNIDVYERYSDVLENQLISQSHLSGSEMRIDENLQLYYSIGNQVIVPDFRNQGVSVLKTWIEEQNDLGANLVLVVKEVENNQVESGKISTQDIINGYINSNGTIEVEVSKGMTVPRFKEMKKDEAILFGASTVIEVSIQELYIGGFEYGAFVHQSILPGTKANGTTHVVVVYSLGGEVSIPSFIDQPLIEIESWMREVNQLGADLKLDIHERYDLTIPYGQIIVQSSYNKFDSIYTTLEVVVSKGQSYTVPNLSNFSRESVEAIENAHNLNIIFEYGSSTGVRDRVISQSPKPGTVISKNDVIYIELSE